MNTSLRSVAIRVSVCAMLSTAVWGIQAQNQTAQSQTAFPMAQQQYRMAVARANNEPFKVDVQPIQQGVHPGTPTKIKVELRNARNEPVNALQPVSLEIKTKTPSDVEQTQRVTIAPNTSSAEISVTPAQAGLWKLEVREANDHLKSGSNYMVVSAARLETSQAPHVVMKRVTPSQDKKPRKATQPASRPQGFLGTPRLVLAAFAPQPQGGSTSEPDAQPGIILKVSGEGDGKVRADGTAAARVSVFLLSPQTTDVRVWLAVSQGQLDRVMITIPRGEFEAEAKWTSRTAAEQSKVSITQTSPAIAGMQQASATVDFVDPIVGIAFANPISSMNIVEMGTVAVRFVDQNATPVLAHTPLSYRFSVNSARLKLAPAADRTKAGAFDFSTNITPSALGNVTIEAAVEGFPPITQPLKITGLLLLAFCMLGGAAGALVNHLDRKQKGLFSSLTTGIIVALPVTWLYVWVGLPNLNAALLHNQLSAVMVAILAGVGGAAGLKAAAKKFGIDLFDSAGSDAGVAPGPVPEKAQGAKG
ncbi:MAG: hypothetical protein JWM83_1538 [Candidatus Angelobacter sp.]|nr:hypothetical protein [Candidatus Angelobacter sp.]